MRKFPQPITNLVAAFSRLPGVGPKTALRYVFYMLKQPSADLQVMARALVELGEKIQVCDSCFTYTETTRCEICINPKRDQTLICVVEESRDIATIESTDSYNGLYHVLGGSINAIEGVTPEVIRSRELFDRIEKNASVTEIILALSPTVQGEMTMMYLSKQLAKHNRHVSRLARGLPMGASIEFADEVTLGDAMKTRRSA